MLSSCLAVLANGAILSALPTLAAFFAENANDANWTSLLVTLPGIFTALSGVISGWMIDRWGRLVILRMALALYATSGGLGALCSSLPSLLIGRAILGFTVGTIATTTGALIADYFSGTRRQQVLSLQACCMGFSGVVFIAVGGILADINWRLAFTPYLGAWVVFALSYFLHEPTRPRNAHPDSPATLLPFRVRPILGMLILTGFFLSGVMYITYTQVAFYIKEANNISNTTLGLVLASFNLLGGLTTLYYPWVFRYLRFAQIFALGFFIWGCGYCTIAYSSSLPYCIVGLSLAGMGFGLAILNLFTWLNYATPDYYRGRANGALQTMIYFGQFLIPFLFGFVFNILPFTAGMIIISLCLWVVAIVYHISSRVPLRQ